MTDEEQKALVRAIKASMADEFRRVNDSIERLGAKVTFVEQRLASFESEVYRRFDEVDHRLGGLEDRVSRLEAA